MERFKLAIKLLLLPVFLSIIIFVFFYKTDPLESPSQLGASIQRPIEDDAMALRLYKDSFVQSYELEPNWQPVSATSRLSQPLISGAGGIIVELESGQTLFEQNPRERRKIASLTKIMTAVVALEHKELDTKMTISKRAAGIGENTMGLTEGEVYTFEELLYGLILHSGNDSAFAIAENTASSVELFVSWMNIKAGELGLRDTYFADPSGLNDDTYSTPADLVKLTRYALKNPDFKRIVKTVSYTIPSTSDHKYVPLENQTNLLTTYPGVAGVKTGYTEEAGLCLVTYASNGGREVIGVVLNSIDRKGDMILMLDHGFNSLGVNVTHNLLD